MSTSDGAGADSGGVERDSSQDASRRSTPAGKAAGSKSSPGRTKKGKADKPGRYARLTTFLRQVVAELRKVIWPTRSELINYASVVLVFVVIMAAILAVYDFAFARAVFFVFSE